MNSNNKSGWRASGSSLFALARLQVLFFLATACYSKYHCCSSDCVLQQISLLYLTVQKFCSFSNSMSRRLKLFLSLGVKSGQLLNRQDLFRFQQSILTPDRFNSLQHFLPSPVIGEWFSEIPYLKILTTSDYVHNVIYVLYVFLYFL